jgi:hypothetical protein
LQRREVAARSVLILPKHGIDRHGKLDRILLIDAAGVDSEVFQFIGILKNDLLLSPGMREYCISRDIAIGRFMKDDLAVGFMLQKAYKRHTLAMSTSAMFSIATAPSAWAMKLVLVTQNRKIKEEETEVSYIY